MIPIPPLPEPSQPLRKAPTAGESVDVEGIAEGLPPETSVSDDVAPEAIAEGLPPSRRFWDTEMTGDADAPVTIAGFQYAAEAELAKMHLGEEGIRAFLADVETVNMDWLLGIAVGSIKLQVRRADAEAAHAILAKVKEQRNETETVCLACGTKLSEADSVCPSCGWSYELAEEV